MKRYWQIGNWSRLFWWSHAIGVAGFYTALWWRTRSDEARLIPEPNRERQSCPFVTIIVPARNEEDTIRRCVTSLLEQDYPSYELIVVDDGSTDCTPQILDEIARTHSNGEKLRVLRLSKLPDGWAGKPHALHAGTQEARGTYLLFTDADTWH